MSAITQRRTWARALIARARGPIAPYGSPEWLAMPSGPEKIAAVIIAAECWAMDGDDLETRLLAELDADLIAHKRTEDADFRSRREAHKAAWDGNAGRFRPDPRIAAEIEQEWDQWRRGGAA